jgi:hypothetical protein
VKAKAKGFQAAGKVTGHCQIPASPAIEGRLICRNRVAWARDDFLDARGFVALVWDKAVGKFVVDLAAVGTTEATNAKFG